MLALTVRVGDYVTIGDDIVVQVLKTGEVFRIAIDAPRSLSIRRGRGDQEISQLPPAIQRARRKAPSSGGGVRKAPPDPTT